MYREGDDIVISASKGFEYEGETWNGKALQTDYRAEQIVCLHALNNDEDEQRCELNIRRMILSAEDIDPDRLVGLFFNGKVT